jgi:lipopolysaccharide/colanic/teichoic acid biosynthesis glycosyltransferase
LRAAASRDGTASSYRRYGKRVFDLALVVMLVPVLVPLIAALLFIVRRDGGPGLFGHMRVGQDGTMFRCWKIRTMVTDSEARLERHLRENPAAAAEWARDHKLADDPRVTRIGKFLRRTSLDELPQLWNVLRGEMTFVGPRPIVLEEMARYGPYQAAYLAMKPGVTGLWQVSGRNNVTYDERVQMDVDYFDKISFALDAALIAKTALAVVNRTGK